MTSQQQSLEDVRAIAVEALKAYRLQPEANRRELRTTAQQFLTARELIPDAGGNPDRAGKTYQYKQFVSNVASEAGFSKEDRSGVLSLIRHHQNVLIEEAYSPEVKAALGRKPGSPNSRAADKRRQEAGIRILLRQGGSTSPSDDLELARLALAALERISDLAFSENHASHGPLKQVLDEVERRIHGLNKQA